MVRPYAAKWLKRKRKTNAAADAAAAGSEEEEHGEGAEEQAEEEAREVEEKKMRGEVAAARPEDGTGAEQGPLGTLPGLPLAAPQDQRPKPGVIFILEKASLRVGRVGKKEHILTADDDANYLKNKGENPADFRPDIVHQAMLAILDSPLNKAGRLQALYVKTDDGELIDVKPYVRLPRTFKRFCGLMYQLKNQKSIHATGKREKLFRMIKNPVTKHLPVNSRKIGLSYSSQKLVHLHDYFVAVGDDVTLVFVVGAMAHGKIDADYTDDFISELHCEEEDSPSTIKESPSPSFFPIILNNIVVLISAFFSAVSNYPLSAACCISRLCNVLEQRWNIL